MFHRHCHEGRRLDACHDSGADAEAAAAMAQFLGGWPAPADGESSERGAAPADSASAAEAGTRHRIDGAHSSHPEQDEALMDRGTQYPCHLARLVGRRLLEEHGTAPPETVLVRLFETLYFASFQTDEGRKILCTVNFVDPDEMPPECLAGEGVADRWGHVRFDAPLPMDVRNLTKLARAADPDVSSLTVFAAADGELFILGLVDQEPRHGDHITLDNDAAAERPGLFQASITGTGTITVHHDGQLLGNLSQNVLVEANYDVLWNGPVHGILSAHQVRYLREHRDELGLDEGTYEMEQIRRELMLRWLNALSRILVNAQHYHHGGGFVITPDVRLNNLHIKYRIRYDRLVHALMGLVRAHFLRGLGTEIMRRLTTEGTQNEVHKDIAFLRDVYMSLEQRKGEVLGSSRFIASLSCVDGVVLLDQDLTVHGFGVELRADSDLEDIYIAGDAQASPAGLRSAELTQYGTRHRAIMRYCFQHPGALGFAVSQDGAIQTITRLGDRLVLWENIDVQLAFKADNWGSEADEPTPVLRRLAVRLDV